MQPADRKNTLYPFRRCGGNGRIFARHAADQMPPGGMAGQGDITVHFLRQMVEEAPYFPCDTGNARFGAQRIAWHGHAIAARKRALRQMRPEAFVQSLPIAAMDINKCALGRTFRQEEVIMVPRAVGIGDVRDQATLIAHLLAKAGCQFRPARRIGGGIADGLHIVVSGIVVVQHRSLLRISCLKPHVRRGLRLPPARAGRIAAIFRILFWAGLKPSISRGGIYKARVRF